MAHHTPEPPGLMATGQDEQTREMAVALAAANMGTWRLTSSTRKLTVSENLLALFGLNAATFSGTLDEILAAIHPDDVGMVREAIDGAFARGALLERRFRVVWPDGQVHWLFGRGQVFNGKGDTPSYMIGATLDVTESVAAQAALTASEEQYRCIIANSLDAIVVIDENDRVVEWNRAAEVMFGWPKAEVLGQSINELIIPNRYREGHARGMQRLRETGEGAVLNMQLELAALRRDGSEFPIEIAISHSRMSDGQNLFSASVKDISGRKEAEDRLRQSQERLAFTLKAAEAGVWEADAATGSFQMNALASERYGWPPEDTVRSFEEVFERMHPDDRYWVRERYEQVARGGDSSGVEYRVVWPDGQVRWLLSQGKAVADAEGRGGKVFGITLDVTESKEIEEALRQSENEFRLLIESITDYAVIVLSCDGLIESWNKGAEEMFGYLEEDVLGKDLSFTIPPDERHQVMEIRRQGLATARADGRATLSGWSIRKNGTRFFSKGMTFPLWQDRLLRGYVKVIRDETQQRESEEQMMYLATHDSLTGLPNRAALSDRLHTEIARARRENKLLALMVLDLDRFKAVNDTRGHHIGDLLLKEVATRLQTSVRETDVVARLGGDEFVILASSLEKAEDAGRLAQKIIDELGRPYILSGTEVHSSTSIGIALYPADATETVDLMKYADLALYQAKAKGRRTYQHFNQNLYSEALKHAAVEEGLRNALRHNEFKLHYQPIIDIGTSEIYGVEALLRWETSSQRVLSPQDFMAVAEASGLIVDIGEWVLLAACTQAAALQQKGVPPFHLAVNLSARQIKEPGLPRMIQRVLLETGLEPALLDLELPESLILNEANESVLQELKALGLNIVIDDFGTGLSALSYIRQVVIDGIKIDKGFIDRVAHSRSDNAIVGAAISLARNLGIRVVAEGVETLEQLTFLKSQGCTSAQGFLIGSPVDATHLEVLLHEGRWFTTSPS